MIPAVPVCFTVLSQSAERLRRRDPVLTGDQPGKEPANPLRRVYTLLIMPDSEVYIGRYLLKAVQGSEAVLLLLNT